MVEDGYAVVEGVLTDAQLEMLRRECGTVVEGVVPPGLGDQADVGEVVVRRFGCVLEPWGKTLSEQQRLEMSRGQDAYSRGRAALCRGGLGDISRTISRWLFQSELTDLVACILGENFYLYNEQYLYKPGGGLEGTAFDWHRDSDRARSSDAFVSCWFALTDCDTSNGGLVIRPYGLGPEEAPVFTRVKAGSLIMLAHDVEHCSTPNCSSSPRLAYMVQYSQVAMRLKDGGLVGFAAPIRS